MKLVNNRSARRSVILGSARIRVRVTSAGLWMPPSASVAAMACPTPGHKPAAQNSAKTSGTIGPYLRTVAIPIAINNAPVVLAGRSNTGNEHSGQSRPRERTAQARLLGGRGTGADVVQRTA